jgi:hypothetical protein
VLTIRFWSTAPTEVQVPKGATGDSANPTNGVSRNRRQSRFSTSDSRPGSIVAGRTNRSDFQRRSTSAVPIRRALVCARLISRLCKSVGDSSSSRTAREPSGNCDQTRSLIAELCRVAIAPTLVLCHSIPEFWECFLARTVRHFHRVGRAGLLRPPRHRGTGC